VKAASANPLLSLLNASSTIKSTSRSGGSGNGSASASGGGQTPVVSSSSSRSAKRAKVSRSRDLVSDADDAEADANADADGAVGHDSPDDSEYEGARAPAAASARTVAVHSSSAVRPSLSAVSSSPFVPSASVAALIAASLEPEVHPTSGSVIYICRFAHCGDTFKTRFSLKRHLKKHSGEKPFACSFAACAKRFAEKSTLKRHVRIHTGEKPYKCSVTGCGKYFADRTNVKRHEMIHSGMRPYCRPTRTSHSPLRRGTMRARERMGRERG
jgi:hypothetical protein